MGCSHRFKSSTRNIMTGTISNKLQIPQKSVFCHLKLCSPSLCLCGQAARHYLFWTGVGAALFWIQNTALYQLKKINSVPDKTGTTCYQPAECFKEFSLFSWYSAESSASPLGEWGTVTSFARALGISLVPEHWQFWRQWSQINLHHKPVAFWGSIKWAEEKISCSS